MSVIDIQALRSFLIKRVIVLVHWHNFNEAGKYSTLMNEASAFRTASPTVYMGINYYQVFNTVLIPGTDVRS